MYNFFSGKEMERTQSPASMILNKEFMAQDAKKFAKIVLSLQKFQCTNSEGLL